MMAIVLIVALLSFAYTILMLLYRKGWQEQPVFQTPDRFEPYTSISIIISARNEEANVGKCLKAILAQDYPAYLYEVIVVDDHSTDDTVSIVNNFKRSNIRCLKLADYPDSGGLAFKKKALTLGIQHSSGELIVTTDADCSMGTMWLTYIAAIYQIQHAAMIVAPVDFFSNGSTLETFQSLDFLSMQGITAASHKLNLGNMSNGANLAFSRKSYDAVGGYKGIDHLASGDDYLLMMKFKKLFPHQISYLKASEAIVYTNPQPTWLRFLQQRIRWASKSGKYDDKRLTLLLMLVYLFNGSLILLAILSVIDVWYGYLLAVLLLLKIEVELYYLFPVAGFFKKRNQLFIFPFLQPLHICYIVLAGFLGFKGVYKWKGRTVR